uniref:Si:ch211-266i6.3 n=1 Tax=Scleropages formosus TaxID=113540 RepID=A0A8C9TI91_SCLFO
MKSRTLSQAFLSQQAVQQKKLVAEVTKPHATMPPKATLGTYKGRVVPSKINSFRRKPADDGEPAAKAGEKPLVPMAETLKKPGNVRRERTKSAASIPGPLKPSTALQRRPKSTSDKTAQPVIKPAGTTVIKSAISGAQKLASSVNHPAAGTSAVVSAGPGCRIFPATLNQKGLPPGGKPRVAAVANEKTKKLSGSSTVSQYRVSMETAEERRWVPKLSDWLASKGRTLKRPPIASTLSQPQSNPKPTSPMHLGSNLESQVVAQSESVFESAAQPNLDPEPETKQAPTPSPDIMNTTLDLLDNSDMDLPVDPQVRMEDLVVNLCSALEAMEVLSSGGKLISTFTRVYEFFFIGENVTKVCQVEQQMEKANILEPAEEIFDQKVKEEGSILMESGDECVEETEMEAASVVRYSVRTTPYLQNMKQRIQCEMTPSEAAGRHRQSSAIKDLKFLTPVRRSCRIHRQSARLPGMLTDHDPTVSSLAELAKLDDDANAYIFRRNPALLETLPDQPGEVQSC